MTTPEDTRVAKLEAELADYRKAWAILDEPSENLRHAHTATEAATQFRARLDAAIKRAEAAERELAEGRAAVVRFHDDLRATQDARDALAAQVAFLLETLAAFEDAEPIRYHEPEDCDFDRQGGQRDCPRCVASAMMRAALADPAHAAAEWERRIRETALVEMREHCVRCVDEEEPIQHRTMGDALRRRDAKVAAEARAKAIEDTLTELGAGLCFAGECFGHCGFGAWRGCAAIRQAIADMRSPATPPAVRRLTHAPSEATDQSGRPISTHRATCAGCSWCSPEYAAQRAHEASTATPDGARCEGCGGSGRKDGGQ